MPQRGPPAAVPTAMQQRLEWKPAKGAAFRQMRHFVALLKVYSFANGKNYRKAEVEDSRKEADYVCDECRRGHIYLCIHRKNATVYWWVVRIAEICNCGSPPALLENLKSNGPTGLVGLDIAKREDWEPLAFACFPCGFVRDRRTSRHWCISCQTKDCAGEMQIQLQYARNNNRKYRALRIQSAIDCSKRCREIGNQDTPVSVRPPRQSDRACPLCCQEQPDEWIKLPCNKQTCRCCFEKLIQSCPSVMLLGPSLIIFDPDHNAAHCYHCPFCKVPYTPRTKVVWHQAQDGGVTAREVEVRNVVTIPYAYQSFAGDKPAHIATADEYAAMEVQYAMYWDSVAEDTLRETAVVPTTEPPVELDVATHQIFDRLQVQRADGTFRRHRHEVLNFIEAVEDLHERGVDGGFLRRVANAIDNNQRHDLMQSAYENGWGGRENIDAQLVLNLLQRNLLVEVIDLVSDDDYSDTD